MPKIILQNATSRRGSGFPGGGGTTIPPGTDNYFPVWAAGVPLSATSPLSKGAGTDNINHTGASALRYGMTSSLANAVCEFLLRNSATNPAQSLLIRYDPLNNPRVTIQGPGQVFMSGGTDILLKEFAGSSTLALTNKLLTYTNGNFEITRTDAVAAVATITNTLTGQLPQFNLANVADARTFYIQLGTVYTILSASGSMALQATSILNQQCPIILATAGNYQTWLQDGAFQLICSNVPAWACDNTGFIIGDVLANKLANTQITCKAKAGVKYARIALKSLDTDATCVYDHFCDVAISTYVTFGSTVAGTQFGIAVANRSLLKHTDGAGLLIGTQNTAGTAYKPIDIGQDSTAGSRVLIGLDASGNIVLLSTSPLYWGPVATDGTHRIIFQNGELDFEERVSGSYVSDVHTYTGNATGTTYTLTTTYGLVDFGTTDPAITITRAGTYMILTHCTLGNDPDFSGTVSFKVRRTNNTAADIIEDSRAFDTDSGGTKYIGKFNRTAIYTTANTTDILQLWAKLSVSPTVGTYKVLAANIVAIRLR